MKKFFLILLFCFLASFPTKIAKAQIYTKYVYARVESENVYLYKNTQNTSLQNAYFAIPASYFVLLYSSFDDSFYKAQYKDIVGYVLKSDVQPVAEVPKNPYPKDITFRVFTSDGLNVFASPFNTQSPTIVGTVGLINDEIEFYGKMVGDEYISGLGSFWYYCKYLKNNVTVTGYLYTGYCYDLKTISTNRETVTAINEPFADNDTGYLYNLIEMPTETKILLISMICAPSLILVYLMFKPFSIEKQKFRKLKSKTQTINKIQRMIDDEPL